MPSTTWAVLAVAAVLAATVVTEAAAERPAHRVPRVEGPIRVDAVLDEPAWQQALVLELAYEVEPGDNTPAPVRTEVLLAYGERAFYIAFRAFDPAPEEIWARFSDHDQVMQDDWVHFVLDTFADGRRAFDFFVNPLGVQGDAIETTGAGFNREWDAIWDSAGRITEEGYLVEVAIPFSSLRFQPTSGDQEWGFDAVRSYPRRVRHKLTIAPRDRNDNCYLCQLPRIVGFAGASPGRNLELTPTLTGVHSEGREASPGGGWVEEQSELEAGLTARWGITPNLSLSGTLNPDFSQVEADAAQLEVNTRFSLFYSEKRPFFLEGVDTFQTPIRAVYTRTMADPDWGTKVTGKVGGGTLGAFVVRDAVTNLVLPGPEGSRTVSLGLESTAAVARYRQDLGASSTLGLLVTDRRADGYHSSAYGLDLDLRFSPTDTVSVQALGSETSYPEQVVEGPAQPSGAFDGHALEAGYHHATSRWDLELDYTAVSPGFRADLGYVPRTGYREYEGWITRIWRHDDPRHWYNQLSFGIGFEHTEGWDGGMLESAPELYLNYQGPFQSTVIGYAGLGRQTYRGVEYDARIAELFLSIRAMSDLRLGMSVLHGDGIDYEGERPGRRTRFRPSVDAWVGRRLSATLSWIHERFDLDGEGDEGGGRLYTADLAELRTVVQFNRRAFLRLILQYGDTRYEVERLPEPRDPESSRLLSQLLFSYRLNPWTALYLGYSDSARGDSEVALTRDHRTVFVKVGYAWVP